jgi:hypothetical protein
MPTLSASVAHSLRTASINSRRPSTATWTTSVTMVVIRHTVTNLKLTSQNRGRLLMVLWVKIMK